MKDLESLTGRELDGAVALAVMGWKSTLGTRKDLKTGAPVHHVQIENPRGLWWELELTHAQAAIVPPSWWCDEVGLPRYSSDPQLTIQVLATARARGAAVAVPEAATPERSEELCRAAIRAVAGLN